MCHIGRLLGQISYESLHGHGLRHCMGHPYNLCLPLRPREWGVGVTLVGLCIATLLWVAFPGTGLTYQSVDRPTM